MAFFAICGWILFLLLVLCGWILKCFLVLCGDPLVNFSQFGIDIQMVVMVLALHGTTKNGFLVGLFAYLLQSGFAFSHSYKM